jgi:hypothetical protein
LAFQTGLKPNKRRKDGDWLIEEETGLIFGLIPDGTFRMGGNKPLSPKKPEDLAPYEDPFVVNEELRGIKI